ncbi:MAG: hypothetical protein PGN08_12985 [Sphingomonas taxi]
MYMGRVEPAAELLPAGIGGDLADRLAVMTQGVEDRFRAVGENLASAIGTIDAMAASLDDIGRALSPEAAGHAVARLRGVADRLVALPATRLRRDGEVDLLLARTRDLGVLLAEMDGMLRLLGIYGMNIKIASSGEAAFFHFATGMEAKLTGGHGELRRFIQEMDRFGEVIRDVRSADRQLAHECERIDPDTPAELRGNADQLEAHLDRIARMAGDVGAIMRTVQTEVGRSLAAIQVGDSARQRAEHCITILRRIDPAPADDDGPPLPPGAVRHLGRLVSAQLQATAHDLGRDMAAVLQSLEALAPLADDLFGTLDAQGGAAGDDDALVRMERGIAAIGDVTGQLREADRTLAALTGTVGDTVADLTQGLGRIRRIAVDVQDIATNTRLLCRRHGMVGRAVAVIATEVTPCAAQLDRMSLTIADMVDTIARIDLVRGPPGGGDGAGPDGADLSLDDALATVRAACASSQAAVSHSGSKAQVVFQALKRSADGLVSQQTFCTALEHGALELSADDDTAALTDADEAALRDLLPWAAGLYTMAGEREILAAFLLPGMAPVASAAAVIDDDDDGLF